MFSKVNLGKSFLFLIVVLVFAGCREVHPAEEPQIVPTPEKLDEKVSENLQAVLLYAKENKGALNDDSRLMNYNAVAQFYEHNQFKSFWSNEAEWQPIANSMYLFIKYARFYGLFPQAYHLGKLALIRHRLETDSIYKLDATSWTQAELLLTDAFMAIAQDMKQGRLQPDSISIVNQQKYIDSFFIMNLNEVKNLTSVSDFFISIEPSHTGYQELRKSLKDFVVNMDRREYLYLKYPYKDSIAFVKNVHKRLTQSGYGSSAISLPDSITFTTELKEYQANYGLIVDGIAGQGVVRSLNNTDQQKFNRIAVTLDRYKTLPELPDTYIWVNIPAFRLWVIQDDSVVLESKVIVGKPATRTPQITSAISDLVIYPQWTIPASIIKKDILPQLKKDPGYLYRKGFSLLTYDGELINPFSVDWSKYTKGIPWKVVQGSGDDNALGIFKFNFKNPYSVYLHDTNQRYLFSRTNRALSHGCVRVQKWKDLAVFIAALDSTSNMDYEPLHYNIDSINTWIETKHRTTIMVKHKLPLYIRYFTCEVKNGEIVFHGDIYNNDDYLAQKYFAGK